MADDRRHQQRVDAILLDDFTERARILWMRYHRRLYLIGEMPHPDGHVIKHVCVERDAATHRVVLGERFEDQITSARIGQTKIAQPRRATAAEIVDDVQLNRQCVGSLRFTAIGRSRYAGNGVQNDIGYEEK